MANCRQRRLRMRIPRFIGRASASGFIKNEDGVYAIEFAMIAVPFFALLFMIFEVAFTIFANQLLDNAVADASRLIRTGQAHQQKFDQGKFKQEICDGLSGLFDCGTYLHLDVKTYKDFATAGGESSPLNEDGDKIDTGKLSYNQGGAGEIVVVRVYYEWPMISPISGSVFSNLANGRRLLASVSAFRNEPFPW